MDKELRKVDERLVEQTKKQLELWRRVMGVTKESGVTADEILAVKEELMRSSGVKVGVDPTLDKDRAVVSINLNGVVVGPEDSIIFSLHPDHDVKDVDIDGLRQALEQAGINPDRAVLVHGMDVTAVKPPAHPPEQASVSEQLGSAGPWCNTTQRAVERSSGKVNDPLPIPPGYHIEVEKTAGPGLRIALAKDTLEQVAAQSVGKPFKDQKGNVLGTVERAWVEDGKVLQSVAWGKVPDGVCVEVNGPVGGPGNTTVVTKKEWNNLISWCDQAAKAQTDRIEGLILDEPPPEQKKDGFDLSTGKLTIAEVEYDEGPAVMNNTPLFPPKPAAVPSRPCGYCNGTGKMISHEHTKPPQDCPVCGGKGSR
jgi:hypothetical protein